jgi:uncharacterized protein YndB with AHSA1/START domain
MENLNEISKRVLTIKKTFHVPVQTVWEAWTEPGHIAQWWAPKGMKVTIVQHEFKPGGKWKYTMPMPDGSEFISEGEYLEIVEHEKIVTTANFIPMTEGVTMHILFEEKGDSTDFTFSIIHPTEAYCRQQEQMGFYNGWGTAFDRLDKYLTLA